MNRATTRMVLALAAAALVSACAAGGLAPTAPATGAQAAPVAAPEAPVTPAPPAGPELAAAARALDAALRAQLARGGLARADGYVYGLDVAALLLYAAERRDAELYDQVLPLAQKLVRQDPDDPYTAGFVLVRSKDGARPAESGAAEALWMARALWQGAEAFGRDRDLALLVLGGYTRHTYELQGMWLARRGFSFAERSFANWSTLRAYQPDFLARAERAVGRVEWRGFASRSYAVLERAATPSRLLLPVIQPEVGATFPGAGVDLYAPNGVASLEDSCLGAEGAVRGRGALGGGLLDFVLAAARGGRLQGLYSIDDGAAVGAAPLSGAGYACLTRLAAALGRSDALALLDPRLTAEMTALARSRSPLAAAGPLLLAAAARGAF